MAIISNNFTRQAPMSAAGRTGVQSVKFIAAPRVFIKTLDVTATPVIVKANGSTPSGWTDLGIVNGVAKITYSKDQKEVRTGIEQVLRGVYIDKKTAGIEADLSQFDDVVIESMTGLTASVTTAGSVVSYGLGNESIVTKALLLVVQNLLDGKEIQLYNPGAFVSLDYNNSGDEVSVKLNGDLPLFNWQGNDTALRMN